MAKKDNSNTLFLIGGIAVALLLNKDIFSKLFASTSGSTNVDDQLNTKLTYLNDWAAGNGSLVAIVTGAAAEGINSINTLYGIVVKFNNNQPDSLTPTEQTFWYRIQSQYA